MTTENIKIRSNSKYFYCDVYTSCLDSHSDGTHSLQKIHWWVSDGMLNFSGSALIKNKKNKNKQTNVFFVMNKVEIKYK